MDNVSIDDKVKIASEFLLSSPPGEVNDVFNGNLKYTRYFLLYLFYNAFCL